MMDGIVVALLGSMGTVAFFAFVSFAVWINYRKEKGQRDAAHLERMKALELGHPPPDADIARANAYASAAWAAGLVGLLVPIVVVSLAVAGTIVAIIFMARENIAVPLIVAWSIAGGISLATIVLSLNAIRQLPRPTGEPPSSHAAEREKRAGPDSAEIQKKRLEL